MDYNTVKKLRRNARKRYYVCDFYSNTYKAMIQLANDIEKELPIDEKTDIRVLPGYQIRI